MITRETPGVTVSLGMIVPVVLVVAAIVLVLGRLALAAQKQRATTGIDGLLGSEGWTRMPLAPGSPGQIDVHGEIWRAFSRGPVPAGAKVRVIEVNGLTLVVEPAPSTKEGENAWKA